MTNQELSVNVPLSASPQTRVCSVEWMRVLFCLAIVLYHADMVTTSSWKLFPFPMGYYCVEFFFVLGGFFLFYKRNSDPVALSAYIKKLYIRLEPALLAAGVCSVCAGFIKFYELIYILILSTGWTLPFNICWGDWFVSVYFWVSVLYTALLHLKGKIKWLVILGLLCFFIGIYNPYQHNLNEFYFGWFPASLARGIIGIGIGILTAAVCQHIHISPQKRMRWMLTIVEAGATFLVLQQICCTVTLNSIQIQLVFAILLAMCMCEGGYLSAWLNRQHWICHISKYTYSVFVMQMFTTFLVLKWKLNGLFGVLLALGLPIVLGILEYHLIEKRLMTWLRGNVQCLKY